LRDENEVLLDENDYLNNTINRMREDANDNNIRFNQILNQKNKQQGFLMNQLNVFQTANQINMSNVIKLSQQNDESLFKCILASSYPQTVREKNEGRYLEIKKL